MYMHLVRIILYDKWVFIHTGPQLRGSMGEFAVIQVNTVKLFSSLSAQISGS